jgi:Domain of unknown function (DUF4129)
MPDQGMTAYVTSRAAAVRTAVVAGLLAAAVIGLRARGAFSREGGSGLASAGARGISGAFGVAEGAGLVACVIVFVLALPGLRPQKPAEEDEEQWRPPVPWWAKPVLVLFALAVLAAPWFILLAARKRRPSTTPLAPLAPLVPRPGTGHLATPSGSSVLWPLLAGALLAIAAAAAAAALAWRSRRRDRRGATDPAARAGSLAAGLAAGRDALLSGREPRAAIIACYAAMERGFAAAGSAPEAADTPAEVLTRAGAAGLVRSDSAEELTGLFRRARYSSQPVTSADSDAAASALARMRADLDLAGTGAGRGGQR